MVLLKTKIVLLFLSCAVIFAQETPAPTVSTSTSPSASSTTSSPSVVVEDDPLFDASAGTTDAPTSSPSVEDDPSDVATTSSPSVGDDPSDVPTTSSPSVEDDPSDVPTTSSPSVEDDPSDVPTTSSPSVGDDPSDVPTTSSPSVGDDPSDVPTTSSPSVEDDPSDAPTTSSPSGEDDTSALYDSPLLVPELPEDLQPMSDFRCGFTEADARGNCKKECQDGDSTSCGKDEFCWSTFANYCHVKLGTEKNHPQCNHEMAEDIIRRCGFEEQAARSMCGKNCTSSSECGEAESCFPVHRNLCECFEEQDEAALSTDANNSTGRALTALRRVEEYQTNAEYFEEAKKVIAPYFLEAETNGGNGDGDLGGNGDGDRAAPMNYSAGVAKNTNIVFSIGILAVISLFF